MQCELHFVECIVVLDFGLPKWLTALDACLKFLHLHMRYELQEKTCNQPKANIV